MFLYFVGIEKMPWGLCRLVRLRTLKIICKKMPLFFRKTACETTGTIADYFLVPVMLNRGLERSINFILSKIKRLKARDVERLFYFTH